MKTLETIQKTSKVFYYIIQVFMYLTFVWAGINLVGVICCLIWNSTGVPSSYIEGHLLDPNGGVVKTIGVLLAELVFGISDGFLLLHGTQYLKKELKDGTPFSKEGANELKSLGIKVILHTLVALIIVSIIYACFDLSLEENLSNGAAMIVGLALILGSLVLRHGAELKENNNSENEQNI